MLTRLTLILAATFLTSCATPRTIAPPPDFDQAERAIKEAKGSPAARSLPNTIVRAQKTYADAVALLAKADARGTPPALQQRYLQGALLKANEAQQLAEQAHDLGLRVAAWDGRIEQYAEQQLASRLQDLVSGAVEEACAVSAPSPLSDVEFTTAVAFFADGTVELSDRDMPLVASLVELLQADPSLTVKLVGHSDGRGGAQENKELAYRRAQAVADALKEGGVDTARIEVTSVGLAEAAEAGADPAERQLDRRVEALVTGSEAGWAH
jgi:outer membrane protein OmpA-like peptidoglycan-associated protein